jgi:hypothetical protein
MGVIIKYQVEFPEAGLRVSNDLYSGEFLLDADLTVKMETGTAGTSFSIQLYNLPLIRAKQLESIVRENKLAHVVIRLGYFDGPFQEVLEGIFTSIRSNASGDQLVTSIEGLETAAHLLINHNLSMDLPEKKTTAEIVDSILQQVGQLGIDRQGQLENVSGNFQDKVLRGKSMMGALDDLAEVANAMLLVRDKKVWMGKPIRDTQYEPTPFNLDVNLAAFEVFTKDVPADTGRNVLQPLEATFAEGFKFTIAGDPALRPAHKVTAAVEGFDPSANVEFRVLSLTHKLNMSTGEGYYCQGTALKTSEDENVRRRVKETTQASPATIAEKLSRRMQLDQRERPAIELGQVKAYQDGQSSGAQKHSSTLYFGQRYEREETQPSVRAAIEQDEGQLLRNKPLASPFAWHRCGLVVPVYPGMKALLNHNLNLQDDAIVTGFLWSEQPAIEPPRNREGDWWVCLPVDFDTSMPPDETTQAANDLTANNGQRVIEVKGLKITIGGDTLRRVGERPEEGAEDEFLIEHKSGTTLRIDRDGAVIIEAQRIKIKGDLSIDGNVNVQGNVDIQ